METKYIHFFTQENQLQLKKLYFEHRDVFIGFGKKYGLSETELADIYQDAFAALRKKILTGKMDAVKSSLRTYLFGIGKHLIYDELKRKKKFIPMMNQLDSDINPVEIETLEKSTSLTLEQKSLRENFKKFGKKCQQVLTLFFYRGLSNEEIAEKENYQSEAVVRSQKSRCLKTLKELIKKGI